jgi:hypothetical protein
MVLDANRRWRSNTKEVTVAYIKADQVRSPRDRWTLIQVLVDGGESSDDPTTVGSDPVKWSLAVGDWEGKRRLATRWNGFAARPAGYPQVRGIPTWHILPREFEAVLIKFVPSDKRALAEALLNIPKQAA